MPKKLYNTNLATCLYLHDLYITEKDFFDLVFDMGWIQEASEEMQLLEDGVFGNLHKTNVYHIVEKAIKTFKQLQNSSMVWECEESYDSEENNLNIACTLKKSKDEGDKEFSQESYNLSSSNCKKII